jgi:hypothetical protein
VTAAILPEADTFCWDEDKLAVKRKSRSERQKVKLAEKRGSQVCRLVRKFKSKAGTELGQTAVGPEPVIGMFMQLAAMLAPAGQRSA